MVSDELHRRNSPSVQHQCGDIGDDFKASNLKTLVDRSSSSDDSSKSKSDVDIRSVSDEPIKDQCNRTYSCDYAGEIIDAGSSNGSSSSYIVDDADGCKVVDSGDEDEDLEFRKPISKYTTVFNLTNSLDAAKWSESLCDLKMENLTFEKSKITESTTSDSMLLKLRNYLAEFQELRGGMSRTDYTYTNLIKVISQATGRCLLALFQVVVNVAPVLEIFLHILRFVFDTIIDIRSTTDFQQVVIKTSLFAVQLLSVYVCLTIIFGFIVWPVVQMAFGIVAKIMFYD